MGGIIFFLLIGGIVTAVIVFSIKTAEETKRKWDLAAKELKLRYLKGSMFNPGVIAGKFKKHVIKVDTFSRSSGKNSQTYTRFRIDYHKPLKFKFHITKQNFMHNFGKAFGMQDIEVGDKSFDDKVMIKSNNPTAVTAFLTPEKKKLIETIMGLFHEVNITNSYVEIIIRGTVSNSRLIKSNVKRLSILADGFSPQKLRKDSSSEPHDKIYAKVESPNVIEVIEPVVIEEKDVKAEVFAQKSENCQTEVVKKDHPEKKISKEIEKMSEKNKMVLPDIIKKETEETIGKTEESGSGEDLPKNADKEISDDNSSDNQSGSLALEAFCQEVFESGLSTFDSSKRFEEKFKDSLISWQGTLASAAEFSFDFVFKNSSGVKATYDLIEIDSGFSKTKIKAVVHFPKDQMEILKSSMNNKLKFSGKLVSVDALMKNIFVSEGKLN